MPLYNYDWDMPMGMGDIQPNPFLQDAVILAQELRNTVRQRGTPLAGLPASVVQDALRAYERKRTLRVTKITVRSNIMGRILGEAVTVKAAKETLDIEFKFPSDLQLESG